MTLRKPFFFLLLDSFLLSPSLDFCDASCAASALVPSVFWAGSELAASAFGAESEVPALLGGSAAVDPALDVVTGAVSGEVGTVPLFGSLGAAGGLLSLPLTPVRAVVPSGLLAASLPAAAALVPGVTVSTTAVLPTPPPVPPIRD